MESKSSAAINIASTVTKNKGHQDGVPKTTKKKQRTNILRVAMYMLLQKSGKSKSVHTDVASKWKKFFSSMRPLHINSNQSITQHRIEAKVPAPALTSTEVVKQSNVYTPPAAHEDVVEQLEVFTPPWSPAPQSVASSSSRQTSKYASAQDLQELDDQSDQDEEDCYYDDKYGDEMIDAKAEEFIAKFYNQMKLQRKSYRDVRGH